MTVERVNLSKLGSLLGRLIETVHSQTSHLTFQKRNLQQVYCVCLHGTILELGTGVVSLIESRNFVAIPSVVRTLLEALIDQINLVNSADYFKRMHLGFLAEKLRALKDLQGKSWIIEGDPTIPSNRELDAMIFETRTKINEYKSSGVNKIGVHDRFHGAGMSHLRGIYWLLCIHSHNNIQALERRHFEISSGGRDYRVSFFRPWTPAEVAPYVDTVGAAVAESLVRVTALLDVSDNVPLDEIRSEFQTLRSQCELANGGEKAETSSP